MPTGARFSRELRMAVGSLGDFRKSLRAAIPQGAGTVAGKIPGMGALGRLPVLLRGIGPAGTVAGKAVGSFVASVSAAVVATSKLGGHLQELSDRAVSASSSVNQLKSNQRGLIGTTSSLSDALDKSGSILDSYDRIAQSVRSPEFGIEGLRDFNIGIGRLGVSLEDFLATRGDVDGLVDLLSDVELDLDTRVGRQNLDRMRKSLGDVAAVELQQQIMFRKNYPERYELIRELGKGIGRLTNDQQADLKVVNSAFQAIQGSIRGGLSQVLASLAPHFIQAAREVRGIVDNVVRWQRETGGITRGLMVVKTTVNAVWNLTKLVVLSTLAIGSAAVSIGAQVINGPVKAFGFLADEVVGILELYNSAARFLRLPEIDLTGIKGFNQNVRELERNIDAVRNAADRTFDQAARAAGVAGKDLVVEALRGFQDAYDYDHRFTSAMQSRGVAQGSGAYMIGTQYNTYEINDAGDPVRVADEIDRRNEELRASGIPTGNR